VRILVLTALAGLAVTAALAQGEKKPGPGKEAAHKGPVEIDFAPLPIGLHRGFAVHYSFHAESNTGLAGAILLNKETKTQVRDLVREALAEHGWDVRPVGVDKLRVLSHKGSHPIQAEVTVNLFGQPFRGNPNPTVKHISLAES
jgi:hypothetical protein